MQLLDPVSENHVYAVWLKSELHKLSDRLTPVERSAIEYADINDSKQNNLRRDLVVRFKQPVVAELPDDIVWYEVALQKNDESNLYTLPHPGAWSHLTRGSYKVSDAAQAMTDDYDGGVEEVDSFWTQANRIIARGSHPAAESDPLVLVSSSYLGPYTILDGNRRAVYRIKEYGGLDGHRGFLGRSRRVRHYPYSVEQYL